MDIYWNKFKTISSSVCEWYYCIIPVPLSLVESIRKLCLIRGVMNIICAKAKIANVGGNVYSLVKSATHAHACITELLSVWSAHLPVPGKITDVKKHK